MNSSIRKYMLGRIKQLQIVIARQVRVINMQKSTIATLRARAKIRTRMLHNLKSGV